MEGPEQQLDPTARKRATTQICRAHSVGRGRKFHYNSLIEGSLEVKLPTIWTDEKQSREEAERRERLEERRVEEKE